MPKAEPFVTGAQFTEGALRDRQILVYRPLIPHHAG